MFISPSNASFVSASDANSSFASITPLAVNVAYFPLIVVTFIVSDCFRFPALS
ncbi:MAG: hypothetical protein HFJ59_00460 [Clostridia bacterium]|nr:hypothetical protein [Clostridia bacterium]